MDKRYYITLISVFLFSGIHAQDTFLWAKHLKRLESSSVRPHEIITSKEHSTLLGTAGDFELSQKSYKSHLSNSGFYFQFDNSGILLNASSAIMNYINIITSVEDQILHIVAQDSLKNTDFYHLTFDIQYGKLLSSELIMKVDHVGFWGSRLMGLEIINNELYLGFYSHSPLGGAIQIGGQNFPHDTPNTIYLIKYNYLLNESLWISSFQFPGELEPSKFLVRKSPDGAIYLAGQYFMEIIKDNVVVTTDSSSCSNCQSSFITEINSKNGALSWIKTFSGLTHTFLGDLSVGPNHLIITGQIFDGYSTFDDIQLSGFRDLYLALLGHDGEVINARIFNDSGDVRGVKISQRKDYKFFLGWESFLSPLSKNDIHISLVNEDLDREHTVTLQGTGDEFITALATKGELLHIAGTFNNTMNFDELTIETPNFSSALYDGFFALMNTSLFEKCFSDILIENILPYQDSYKAANHIEINTTIPNNRVLSFYPGAGLELKFNFALEYGAALSVFSKGCELTEE